MNAIIRKTFTDFEGNPIEEPLEGQLGYCPQTKTAHKFVNGEWQATKIGLNMNMYDMNKQIIAQLENMPEEKIAIAKEQITDFVKNNENTFYMLLCNDLKYYTVFYDIGDMYASTPKMADEVILCAQSMGAIKAIDKAEGAIEIWVHPEEEEMPFVMYLFPYDGGIIECQK